MKKIVVLLILATIVSGLIATPSSTHPYFEKYPGWYDPNTGKIHCWDKRTCLHEVVHKVDWESKERQISTTKEYHKALGNYFIKLSEKEELTDIELYYYNFPGVGAEYTEDGWGGIHELYAEMFVVSEMFSNVDIPEEFRRFYNYAAIYNLWEQYPNIKSML